MTRRVRVAVLVWAFGMLVAAFVAVSVSTALETRRLREGRRRRGTPRRRQATDSTSSAPFAMHSAKKAPSGIAEGSLLMARFTAAS